MCIRDRSWANDEFVIGVRNDFAKDWLENRLYDLIARTLSSVIGRRTLVRFVVWSDEIIAPKTTMTNGNGRVDLVPAPPREPARNGHTAEANGNGAPDENGTLNRRYTFPAFVVGPNNRLAHAVALSVAESPGQTYNPLFIYGGVGLGKTHLLHAIGHRCRQDGYRARYISAETFTNDLVMAIRTKQTPEFRERYRTVDVLLIDDIQFIAGKEGTQDEFFHTFNDLHSHGKQVVISSDRSPKALATLEERLLSRFEWGLTADIQPPEEETRRAILLAKADELGCPVPDSVIEFIAHQVRQNIRELEGALNKVCLLYTSELFPPTLRTNLDCVFCLDCARACPYDNVALAVRPPARICCRSGPTPTRCAPTRPMSSLPWWSRPRRSSLLATWW